MAQSLEATQPLLDRASIRCNTRPQICAFFRHWSGDRRACTAEQIGIRQNITRSSQERHAGLDFSISSDSCHQQVIQISKTQILSYLFLFLFPTYHKPTAYSHVDEDQSNRVTWELNTEHATSIIIRQRNKGLNTYGIRQHHGGSHGNLAITCNANYQLEILSPFSLTS